MATYNGERFIAEQLRSILDQLGSSDEIIISDDASTDDTVSIIRSFDDSRIRLLTETSFRSIVLNFENALKHARGEYIFLADQDDIWLYNKIDHMINELKTADLVISDCAFINEYGEIIGGSYFEVYRSGAGVLKNFVKNTYLGNCMAFRRIILPVVLPFPIPLYEASKLALYHDVWIGIMSNLLFRVRFIPTILSSYRRHSANASPTGVDAKSSNNFNQKIKARYLLAIGIIKRLLQLT